MELVPVHVALLAAAGVYIAHVLLVQWRRYEIRQKIGCQPIVKYLHTDGEQSSYDKEIEQAIKSSRFNKHAAREFEKCGSRTFVRTSWDDYMVHTCESLNHQAVVTRMDDFIKEPRWATRPFTGQHIVTQNGPAWRRSRDLVTPLFMRAELNDTLHFQLYVDRMIQRIPRDGSTINMYPLIRRLFIDSATEFIFGRSVDSLRDTTGKSDVFIDAYDRATIGMGKRARPTGFLKSLQMRWTRDDAWLADCKIVHDFIDDCIVQYRHTATKVLPSRKRYILIDGMSAAISDAIELRFQLLSIFSLARETPAVVASNTLFLLARNTDIWTELRIQALNFLAQDITFDKLMALSLFRNTVLETMRLHTPITKLRRMAARDTTLPVGGGVDGSAPAFIPKNAIVNIYMYPNSRDPRIWGEDVEAFRPSRFEGRSLGWEFGPFSKGPRHCPAQKQVMGQVIYMLYRLTLEFESIENRDPCLEYVEDVMMCIHGRNGSRLSFKPAR